MSDVRPIGGSAEAHLPPQPHPAPKRDDEESHPRKRKPSDAVIAEPEAHQLDVEA
jgi:hypothetical protein